MLYTNTTLAINGKGTKLKQINLNFVDVEKNCVIIASSLFSFSHRDVRDRLLLAGGPVRGRGRLPAGHPLLNPLTQEEGPQPQRLHHDQPQ